MAEQKRCNAEHPDKPGVYCERKTCVEYHRNGTDTWDNPQRMPARSSDPVQMADIARRTRARARSTDPATSHEAAASVGDLTEVQQKILEIIAERPRTDEEIYAVVVARGIQMSVSGTRTRRSELVDVGLVEESGQHKLTGAGRRTIVWRATDGR